MKEISVKTPAKINFGLNVINKREDGYHNIETIFYPINLFDEISFRKSDKTNLSCSSNELITNDNLILKAVQLLEKNTGKYLNVEIELIKNIPVGAGLGGGSSDGAAALKALNNLFDLNLEKYALLDFALQLGSDVPFFIDPAPVYAISRGEIMRKINFRISYPLLIVNPGIHISTKWAFANIRQEKENQNLFEIVSKEYDFYKYKNIVKNSFEEKVFAEYPEIKSIKEIMYSEGALFSLMTGTGSTVYGIFSDLHSAQKTERLFNEKYFTFIQTAS